MKGHKRVARWKPDLRRTYQALIKLEAKLQAPPSVREVVEELNLDKNHISKVHGDLLRLEQMGLIKRKPIPTRCFSANGPPADEVDWEKLILGLE